MPREGRRWLAVAILVAWIGGLIALWRRHEVRPRADQLAEAARGLEPSTYYYLVEQNGEAIGGASSRLDTGDAGFRIANVIRGRAVIYGDSQTVDRDAPYRFSRTSLRSTASPCRSAATRAPITISGEEATAARSSFRPTHSSRPCCSHEGSVARRFRSASTTRFRAASSA